MKSGEAQGFFNTEFHAPNQREETKKGLLRFEDWINNALQADSVFVLRTVRKTLPPFLGETERLLFSGDRKTIQDAVYELERFIRESFDNLLRYSVLSRDEEVRELGSIVVDFYTFACESKNDDLREIGGKVKAQYEEKFGAEVGDGGSGPVVGRAMESVGEKEAEEFRRIEELAGRIENAGLRGGVLLEEGLKDAKEFSKEIFEILKDESKVTHEFQRKVEEIYFQVIEKCVERFTGVMLTSFRKEFSPVVETIFSLMLSIEREPFRERVQKLFYDCGPYFTS